MGHALARFVGIAVILLGVATIGYQTGLCQPHPCVRHCCQHGLRCWVCGRGQYYQARFGLTPVQIADVSWMGHRQSP